MDIETSNRYGNKRVHHRLGPSQPSSATANKVCYNWRAGRCTRHPCAFLHSELPETATGPKRAQYQPPAGGDDRGPPHRRPGVHTWRNPNAAKWGGPRAVQKPSDKICSFFHSGKCTFGEKCRNLHAWFVSDSFSLLTSLEGHQKVITGITLPSGSDKLYSAGKDGSVRIWDCQSGQCAGVINLGCEVGCMISEGPWVFVGIPSAVKAWNTQTSTELSLSGPTGQVYALVVGNEMLFAGVQDGRILAWKFSAVGNHFEPAASLVEHQLAVVTLVVGAMKLYSGSMDATIKVWDLTTLQCLQTLTDHTNVVMSVLCWSQFLLSCSLDQTIKVWAATESGSLEVTYTHNEEHGVLALWGTLDAQAKPVLLCSCNDNTVRLYDLPSFGERGKIFSKEEVRAIQAGPGGIFFTGDGTGQLKVWKWLMNEPQATLS